MVAAAFAITGLGFGSAYTFSAFIEPLEHAFAATRGSVSLVFSLAGFLYFGLGVISGPLADRWGARRVVAAGMALNGAGLALAGAARSLPEVYAAYGLGVGLGVGFAYVPAVGAVQRWFVRRRGLASGLAVSGIGVGTLAMPPLASWLIERLTWRGAYLVLGAGVAAIGVLAALRVDGDPRARGMAPDGEPLAPAAGHASPDGMLRRDAIRSPTFLRLYAACLICSFGLFVPFVHLVPYAVDHGAPRASAVLLLGMIGVGSTAGRFLLGSMADRIGRKPALVVMFAGMAASLAVWLASTGWWPLAGFALGFGVFYGGFVAVVPALVMDHFGSRHISSILGALYTSVAFGSLVGPSAAGFVFDLRHSYTLPIAASITASVLAAAIVAGVARPAPR